MGNNLGLGIIFSEAKWSHSPLPSPQTRVRLTLDELQMLYEAFCFFPLEYFSCLIKKKKKVPTNFQLSFKQTAVCML